MNLAEGFSSSTEQPQRIRLSLCMIVRDNAGTIGPCLQSIRPWVDEMVVVDTGSKDETPDIARSLGARVFFFPWCDDFAKARNESLRHASGEWVFWMDSDDTIDEENGRKLRSLADKPAGDSILGYVMQVHCPAPSGQGGRDCTVVDHVKAFRNFLGLEFDGRIHEQVLPSIRARHGEVAWTDVYVVHSGADLSAEGRKRKQQRDLRLLQQELADKPNHPFVWFNLGMTYADMIDHHSAIAALTRCLDISHADESHVRKAYALLVNSLQQVGALADAEEKCSRGLAIFPEDPELLFRSALLASMTGKPDKSIAIYRKVLTNGDVKQKHFGSIDSGITRHKAKHNLAVAYVDLGRHDLAEIQWREILDGLPDYIPAWKGLADVLLRQNKLVTLELETARMGQYSMLRCAAQTTEAQLAARQNKPEEARQKFRDASREFPSDLDLLRARTHFLFDNNCNDEAEECLQQLTCHSEDSAAAHHNLGCLHLRSGRVAEAISNFEESLRIRPTSENTKAQLTIAREMAAREPVLK